MSRPRRVALAARAALALLAAVVLAALSVLVQRVGPELAATGNLCGPRTDEICWEPRVNGGFPFPWLFDKPYISVPHQLAIPEDDVRWLPFLGDVLFWLLAVLLVARLWRRVAVRRRRRSIPAG